MRLPEACGGPFHTLPPSSGTLPVPYFLSLRDEPGQPGQVVGGAAGDEHQSTFSSPRSLRWRSGRSASATDDFLDQPPEAQADGIPGLARRRRSRLLRRLFSFFVTCGVTLSSRP
jgi:hypothetical protein